MRFSLQTCIILAVLALGLSSVGCDSSSSTGSTTKAPTSGLFKTEGTLSFSSNKGNFSAKGIFDTLMSNASASGAFTYTENKKTIVMVFAYNVVSQTNVQLVFSGVGDTVGTVSNGSYPFNPTSGSKVAIFGYMPNIMDTSANSAFYALTKGSFNISSISASAVAGTFAGTGVSAFDTLQTISVTSGTYNTPVVDHYYGTPGKIETMAMQKIRTAVRKELQRIER
ncbi:MAG: hypothetical protein ACOYNS_09140 [Bacteroidota bacterium]